MWVKIIHDCSYGWMICLLLQRMIPFHARVCQSFMETNVEDVSFEKCVLGGVYTRDFTIWNRSEVPLPFEIYVEVGECQQSCQK
jgi:hypothetical protein